MKNTIILLLAVAIGVLLLAYPSKNRRVELKSLVDSEAAFARKSATEGIRPAFLAYLADDAVVLRPTPEPGRQAYANSPIVPGMLTWKPTYADVSRAGDLGYTTGPYQFTRKSNGESSVAFGDYVTVWTREDAGPWRALVDVGVSHPKPPQEQTPNWLSNVNEGEARPAWQKLNRASSGALLQLDRAFSLVSLDQGFVEAYSKYADDTIRFYRPGLQPVLG